MPSEKDFTTKHLLELYLEHTANFTSAVIFFYNPIFKLLKRPLQYLYVLSICADFGLSVICHYDNLAFVVIKRCKSVRTCKTCSEIMSVKHLNKNVTKLEETFCFSETCKGRSSRLFSCCISI